jgi:type IV secretory pathway component VirB8
MPQLLPPVEPTPSALILSKVRSGEFFREAHLEFHRKYHDIMAERYIYLGITGLAIIIFIFAFVAMNLFFPLKTQVPFIFSTNDIINDLPRMQAIGQVGKDANQSLKEYLLASYVKTRESYNIDMLDLNASSVKSHSTDEVFNVYQAALDPRNPNSPIARFQRRATKSVNVLGIAPTSRSGNEVQVRYEATITEGVAIQKERGIANITFRFDDIQVNQRTGATSPLAFQVTSYTTKPVKE